ncbi:MAG TPA: glycosyltransferase N-terminal domain-containing protein [candidate division Zixibacteria bacterium]|nr:glycosyltransferase N-terminal domain-containing protein [candidate division Zixibacteria bacterium]
MIRTLYRLLTAALYALLAPAVALFGGRSQKWRNRLGQGFKSATDENKAAIWAHAASVGEVKALATLMHAISAEYTTHSAVITVMTDRGFQTARKLFATNDRIKVFYAPLDAFASVRRTVAGLEPALMIFTETELWPNMTTVLRLRNIPYALINARVSEKSCRRYARFRGLFGPTLDGYARVIAQSLADADRFISLGVDPNRIKITGNLKEDARPAPLTPDERREIRESLGAGPADFVFVCGSVRPGEETGLLNVYQALANERPQVRLALAPRHDDLYDKVIAEAAARGIEVNRFSQGASPGEHDRLAITLVDVFGELSRLYAASDLSFVGGTMVDVGGHNVLEPPQAGAPVVFGPYTANVNEAAEAIIQERFGCRAQDWNELADVVRDSRDGRRQFARMDVTRPPDKNSATAFTLRELAPLLTAAGSLAG